MMSSSSSSSCLDTYSAILMASSDTNRIVVLNDNAKSHCQPQPHRATAEGCGNSIIRVVQEDTFVVSDETSCCFCCDDNDHNYRHSSLLSSSSYRCFTSPNKQKQRSLQNLLPPRRPQRRDSSDTLLNLLNKGDCFSIEDNDSSFIHEEHCHRHQDDDDDMQQVTTTSSSSMKRQRRSSPSSPASENTTKNDKTTMNVLDKLKSILYSSPSATNAGESRWITGSPPQYDCTISPPFVSPTTSW